jgi:hypothetical protein
MENSPRPSRPPPPHPWRSEYQRCRDASISAAVEIPILSSSRHQEEWYACVSGSRSSGPTATSSMPRRRGRRPRRQPRRRRLQDGRGMMLAERAAAAEETQMAAVAGWLWDGVGGEGGRGGDADGGSYRDWGMAAGWLRCLFRRWDWRCMPAPMRVVYESEVLACLTVLPS